MRGLLWSTWKDEGLLTSAFLHRGTAEELPPSLLLEWLLLHLTTQTRLTHSQSDCINRCFQGGNSWPLTLRSNRGVHVLYAQVHVCFFITFFMYVFGLKRLLGWVKLFSFSPHTACFSNFSSQSEVLEVLGASARQVCSLLTTSCGFCSPLRSLHNYSFSPRLSFPRSRLASPGAPVLGFPHLQHIRVFMLQRHSPQKVHKLANICRRDISPTLWYVQLQPPLTRA